MCLKIPHTFLCQSHVKWCLTLDSETFFKRNLYQIFLSANSYANDLPIPKSKSISTGQYQDGYVALKQLPEYYSTIGDRNSVTNSRFQIEIDQIRELCQIQHNHLARFFGIYKSIDLPTSIVTEYGTKGSLQDLLEDNGNN